MTANQQYMVAEGEVYGKGGHPHAMRKPFSNFVLERPRLFIVISSKTLKLSNMYYVSSITP